MTIFYQKFIFIESVLEELHRINLSDEERLHLSSLIDSTLHHAILDEILTNLNEDDKKIFLKKLDESPEDDKIINFLNERIENIDQKIKKVAEQLINQMHKDIKEIK